MFVGRDIGEEVLVDWGVCEGGYVCLEVGREVEVFEDRVVI